jgi:cyclic-di-GMP-binding protein
VKNSFFLVIPTQQNNPQRLKEFETKALQHWVAELPTANPGLATRLLHDFLIDFNAVEMGVQLRLDGLELLSGSVSVIEDYLRSRLIKSGFPKEENDKKILAVLVSIEKEFTIGYWMVLKELTKRGVGWFQGRNAALAIQRCIKGLGSIIVSHFIMGMPIPDWVWIDLHSLYNLSVTIKNSTAKVANNVSQSSTPETCYKQILLLSLADPTGLMQKEILLVYSFIETVTPLVGLKKELVNGQPIQCIVLTDEDKAPHCQVEASAKNDSAMLYLDFSKLFKSLKQKEKLINAAEARFSSMHALKSVGKPSAELLDYLEQRWWGIDLQGVPFFSDRMDRYIAIGLESTHELQNALEFAGEKELEFLVQSASDRLLSGVFNKTGVLSVGSLVSFRKTDSPEHKRSLGIVNKVIVDKQSDRINFGMQLLAHQSVAVTYIPLDESGKEIPQKGLFYSAKELEYEKSYIVTDSFMLKDEDVIRMFMNNEDFSVVLSSRKNVGLGYWQFECRRVAERDKPILLQTKKGYEFI